MSEAFPVWITKWWQSEGVEQATAYQHPTISAWCIIASGRMKNSIFQPGEWHRTREAAVKEAEKRRLAAIATTKWRLASLENLTFEEKQDAVA